MEATGASVEKENHAESLNKLQENMTCIKVNGNEIEAYYYYYYNQVSKTIKEMQAAPMKSEPIRAKAPFQEFSEPSRAVPALVVWLELAPDSSILAFSEEGPKTLFLLQT